MTTRKPPGVSFQTWVDRQIRTAEAEGAFANLPGTGKPIRDLDRPQQELAWLAGYLKRENVDVSGLLPPALALAKEVEDLPARLVRERSEVRVRELVTDLNTRIRAALRAPQNGPPVRSRTLDVDTVLEQWRTVRAALEPPAHSPVPAAQPTPRRRLFRRRGAA